MTQRRQNIAAQVQNGLTAVLSDSRVGDAPCEELETCLHAAMLVRQQRTLRWAT